MVKFKRRKFITVTTALVMSASLLAGCQKSASSDKKENKVTTESVDNVNKEGFPIVKEPIDLTFFTGKYEPNLDDYEETLVFKKYQEKSGVNVTFNEVPFATLTEKRNLALASGEYPDVFYSSRIPSADLYKYGKQGIFMPLNDLIEEYAPNIKAAMDKHPDIKKGLTMPDGNIYSLPSYYSPEFLPMLIGKPIWIKGEWLEKLGMDEPKTIDEFYQYLKAVKETDLNGNGKKDEIPLSATSIAQIMDSIKGSWGVGTRGLGHKFVDVDPETNELRFFRTDDRFKEVLEFIHKLNKEGLIDGEIYTMDDNKLNAKGSQGILGTAIVPNPETVFTNQKDYIGLGGLKGPHGDTLYSHVKSPLVHVGAFAITDKNKNPQATIRWIDYFFGEEGATLQFMGVEGETYEKNGDGKPQFTEKITNNPDGLTFDQALTPYVTWMGGSYPGYVQEKYFGGSEALPSSVAVGDKVQPDAPKEIWNGFNYTDDELKFKLATGTDLETFINETEAAFIAGDKDFSEWDQYVEQVKQMGQDQYLEVEKAAHDRYQAN
ncbi:MULTISPECIES: extracellular solute-binding protein [Niallia]|jgi:putative aldouronate transport system substrate-binding protein|uniref:extracellular solute-binding protein n=1 Tax=Niallia TaxID=2837506 RepID=UPI00030C56DA|nr:extracellular solute-binding protein [Niallia circulans]AYV73318.1 ABC transporter substrate-binding protein [Niallia circulans]